MVKLVSISSPKLPALRFDFADAAGRVTIYSEGSGGDARFLVIQDGGGHWELTSLRHLPDGNGLQISSTGTVIVNESPD